MSSITVDAGTKRPFPGLAQLQRVGRSLMLPIAALPAAGLLLRLGQPDLLGRIPGFETGAAVIASAGGALFDALPLLFAVGVAIGFAKKSDGSTALAAVVGYLVFSKVGEAMSPLVLGLPAEGGKQVLVNYSVLGGILIGITSALLWQRFHRISLPSYLAFFGGRRFVPIVTAGTALVLGVLLAFVYPAFATGLSGFGEFVSSNNIWGGFLYGTTNRLLIPVGLHHILNSVMWFVIGDFNGAHGDIARFFAGDPTAGSFMTGFFPIMMFALPAGALAIWQEAKPSQKKIVGGIMLSGALTAMLTGVTEPLEFSFMFVAFPLYLIHAVLTGSSLALVNALGIRDGFTFSAGTFDYVLNFGLAEKPLLLIPIGLAYAGIYYFLFRFVIRKWNLKTPGRGEDEVPDATVPDSASSTTV
ncbi:MULTISPECIES: PTS transporter subunit EIIC [unclassified Cryobacterium]|uniref:PTS transporter subunit EIIC n=1 Tax=unclassified Cryobacterium TaxID=2649013 RepID=UPI0010690A77|nr:MULTISPECIES: PTS transporter subunit EIIC [unclassified Cryobacterium]TFB98491.1 PTS N-acetylglucosamine transporter subunit IIBC [Cryobacterium sp. MDB2-A-1]TFC08374.1 PTS N-acetylglucosamine transporter subunit IIBC [Cryobacterium sp. MDB2-33-2]TFC08640.1 PTS N-acetylglucosamine transporter subunit IIBC [Cryobacterium sp. MDB2-A-2]TFC22304.1 PTS N-acetylglucosamine transporter subunit IIBC [Cryobacterium sp. MDB2-10]